MIDAASRFIMPNLLSVRPVDSIDTVVRSLIELGAERDQIEVVPVGIFRHYRGVLLGHSPAVGNPVREGMPIRLYVAERGLADRLPEGFLKDLPEEDRPERVFDAQQGGFAAQDDEELPDGGPGRDLDPYEMARRQLDGGRQLLWVLDRALRRARRDMVLLHQRLWATSGNPEFARRLLALIDLELLDQGDSAAIFAAQSLGGFQEAVGTLDEAAAFLACLFDVPVRAEEQPAGSIPIPETLCTRLGRTNARLGRDTIAGVRFPDPRPGVAYRVGPMSSEAAARRYRDTEGDQRMASVAAALTPAGRPFKIAYEVALEDRRTRPGSPAHGLLGRTTYLSDSGAGWTSGQRAIDN